MTTCTKTGQYLGKPVACHLAAEHEDDHYDKHRHEKWKIITTRSRKTYVRSRWVDPHTEMERWFSYLPNRDMEDNCHCGSGLAVTYWSPEDGTACRQCKAYLHIYIPSAVIWNVLEHFDIPMTPEDRGKLFAALEDPEEDKDPS